ncbi:MAG TPA: hypothetical protein VN285_01970, partial [Candidatus Deferrimicrobium sp.]|nr:hypothetical protein [Candidatus Deferrimicrobium sp.]
MTEFERISVYSIEGEDDHGASFRCRSGNSEFRRSWLTYLTLAFLLGVYPAQALLFPGDTSAMLQSLNQGTLMVVLVVTIVMQWAVFLLLYASSFREQTGLAGLGFQRLRLLDLAWAGAF